MSPRRQIEEIEHIVVLMMENRSFDHMLGLLDIPGMEAISEAQHANEANHATYRQGAGAAYQGQLQPDPLHEFMDVHLQLYGGGPPIDEPPMSGFAECYRKHGGNPANVMRCFTPSQLPVLSELARKYLVCDNWFASVPGPTNPNRAFAHFGTSFGRVDSSAEWFGQGKSIYERMRDAGMDARIYYYSQSSGTFGMTFLSRDYFGWFQDFKDDVGNGSLPAYSFLEPPYSDTGPVLAADQHPDHNVLAGERFIRDVYRTLRGNDAIWSKTLFLIVYDEHGGLYDHCPPPVLPYGDAFASSDPPFGFDRLGVRVPAIVVSPWVKPGVDKRLFEHASIPATVTEQFIGPHEEKSIYPREKRAANTLLDLVTREEAQAPGEPSFDALDRLLGEEGVGGGLEAHEERPVSSLQEEHIRELLTLLRRKAPEEVAALEGKRIRTEGDAADFIERAMSILHPRAAQRRR